MGDNKKQLKTGFTIVEVMLFLAVSSLLFVGIAASWRGSVDKHRYNDMVNTLKSDIQQVFTDVENPVNSTTQKINCTSDQQSISLRINENSGSSKGVSNCIILGKFIRIVRHQKEFTKNVRVSDVVGLDIDTKKACNGECNNSIDAIRATKFVVADGNVYDSSANPSNNPFIVGNSIGTGRSIAPEWKGFVRSVTSNKALPSGGRAFTGLFEEDRIRRSGSFLTGIMVLRSPLDGSVMTFAMPSLVDVSVWSGSNTQRWVAPDFISTQTLVSSRKKFYLCVAPNSSGRPGRFGSIFGVGGKNKIIGVSGSSSSVEVMPTDGDEASWCDNKENSPEIWINGSRI